MMNYLSALQCINITPVPEFNINPALIVHLLNSLLSILDRRHFRGAHIYHIKQQITFASRVTIYTPGLRAAMGIKCLVGRTKSARHWRELNPQPLDPENWLFALLISFVSLCLYYTLKTPGSAWPGKGSIGAKLHCGSTMTRKSVNLTRNMTQSWVILTPLLVNLTDFRVIFDPEWSLAPMDPFPGHGWPGCF